jgi:hypothetical protein
MAELLTQIDTGKLTIGEIVDRADLDNNLKENAVPDDIFTVTAASYPEFLERRRRLMADVIRVLRPAVTYATAAGNTPLN